MSTFQPVRRAASRALSPSLPIASASWSFGTTTVASRLSSSTKTSRTRAGDSAFAMNRAGSVFHGMMSIFSPRSSDTTMRTREPRGPTHAPTGSTPWACDSTAILERYPGSRATPRISTSPSAISGTSSSKSVLISSGSRRERITCGPFVPDRTSVITEVRSGTKGPQVILSRRDPELIKTLFELEVPEIADGLVEIRGVVREPGYRSKIAVESHAQGVDPVGACVGPRGSRVRMVVSELRGEKIDIIPWNNEPARFVAKALSPARVREVYLDDAGKEATVVVPDDQLALAIGKEGMNARLAARLTGWKIDIQSDTEFAQAEAEIAYGGPDGEGEDISGRCSAILSNGKRCPNAALPGSKYCGVPAHQELALHETDEEDNAIVAEAEPELEALSDTAEPE